MRIPREAGMFGVVVGSSAVMTAGFSWLEVMAGWIVCGLLRLTLPKVREENERKGVAWAQLMFGVLIGVAGILLAWQAFPERSAVPAITIGMILLLWRSLVGEEDNGLLVANVLGICLLGLMGTLFLFGLGDVRWKELIPAVFHTKNAFLVVCITSPWWFVQQNRGSWGWFSASAALGVGFSILTGGILGKDLAAYVDKPLYKMVQTVHVFGASQRLEALAASGILMGAFALLLLSGQQLRAAKRVLAPDWNKRVWYGIVCSVLSLSAVIYPVMGELKGSGVTTFWGMILIFALWMVLRKKSKKVLDK